MRDKIAGKVHDVAENVVTTVPSLGK